MRYNLLQTLEVLGTETNVDPTESFWQNILDPHPDEYPRQGFKRGCGMVRFIGLRLKGREVPPEDRSDIFNEALKRCAQRYDASQLAKKDPDEIWALLYTTLKFVVLEYFKKKHEGYPERPPVPIDETIEEREATRQNLEEQVDIERRIERVLSGLSIRQRTIFKLHYRLGHKQKDVAAALGISPSVVCEEIAIVRRLFSEAFPERTESPRHQTEAGVFEERQL